MKSIIYTESRRHLRSNCYPGGTDELAVSDCQIYINCIKLTVPAVGFFCVK
ncbi:hypothetical protein BXY64_3563 [Marinifilum flexuosum]|uniref:Uncharacterized protein n=1 Tax=Marinifilum flexuosum TaxID=1117708 RepID=A0A419WTD0_9BACT|nr:hypothetical protein BXY64_3563 [Marinifilum flexuosum]